MTLKVLHTLDALNRGGAEVLTLDVCRNAAKAGIDVTFLATGGGDLEAEFASCGVEFLRLQRKLPLDPILISRLRRIIKDRDIKIVHAQQSVDAMHLYFATRGTKVKCVISLQNYISDAKNRRAAKFIVPRMDAVVPVSTSMREWYADAGFKLTDKFHIIYNGVDPKRLVPMRPPNTPSLREELGIVGDGPLLGMIGNFRPDSPKDQWTVCRALPSVFARFPSADFVFVGMVHSGAGEYYSRCVDFCRENDIGGSVHFVGGRTDIPDIVAELDLFVFSSRHEGLPVAAIEALMLGVPMIVSDIPPLLEVVGAETTEGPCAEIFRTGDAEDLASRTIDLLSSETRLHELGEQARTQTPERFGIEAHLRRLRNLYEKLASDK